MTDSVRFLGVSLENRSVLASGVLGVTLSSLGKVHREGAAVVTTKSIGPEKRSGHHAPVVFDWGHGLINAVGLSNPGVDNYIEEWKNAVIDFPLVLSIFGKKEEDFKEIAEKVERLSFSFLEINISCPNVLDEFGTPFSFSPELTYRITKSVKDRTARPVIVKLSPNTPLIERVAKSAEAGGGDALCIMNTAGPGMVIDPHTASPVLGNRVGGLSGEAILPLTVKHVFDLYGKVSIPIIGTGGIARAQDALQIMMAGAELYGVGSAVYSRGLGIFREIERGLREFLEANRFTRSGEIVGLAHRKKKGFFFKVPGGDGKPGPGDIHGGSRWIGTVGERERGTPFTVFPVEETLCGEQGQVKTLLFTTGDAEGEARGTCGPRPRPGQFYMLWLPGVDQKPYSVSFYNGRTIGFSLQARGHFSRALLEAAPGEPVGLLGPLGSVFDLQREGVYLLVGGGIGLAPLVFTAMELSSAGKQVCLIAGARTRASLSWVYGLLEREKLPYQNAGEADAGRNTPLTLICCTDDGSHGAKGPITDHLQRVIDRVKPRYALMCGPEVFMRKALEVFRQSGIPGQASIERMMKCGVGVCGSCSIDDTGDRVCVEGPVFSFDYLAGVREFGRYERDESGTPKKIE